MALFKIFKGNSANLGNIKATEGFCYFTPDDGKFYIDIAGDGTTEAIIGVNRICLSADSADKLKQVINISLSGDINGEASFDGSQDLIINTTLSNGVDFLPITGGTLSGDLILSSNLCLTQDINYGFELPEVGQEGQVFYQIIKDEEEKEEEGGGVPAGGQKGQIIVKNSEQDYDANWSDTIDGSLFVTESIQANEITGNKVYGAVWNDYAEFRILKENIDIPYGRCVCENGDDTLSVSTQRLQAAPNLCSDTFGFSIGKTEKAKMPIAVSGRVLAYLNEDKEKAHVGDAVCSGPNGTVSLMSRKEIQEYPDRILGFISAFPNHKTWNNININERIWIKVK